MEFWRKLNKTSTEDVIQISDQTKAHHYKDGVGSKYSAEQQTLGKPGFQAMDIGRSQPN